MATNGGSGSGSGAGGGTGAATATPKTVPGPTGHNTVLQLAGIQYRIFLYYLGSKRIRRSGQYNCDYELHRGADPNPNDPDARKLDPVTEIRNVAIFSSDPDSPHFLDAGVSKPLSEGGDNTGPVFDDEYRIVIKDYHGMRNDDVWPGDLLGSGANNTSKPQNYNTRRFDEDIVPDIPFRVVVRKYLAGMPLDLTANELANLRVAWEVKDPDERTDHVSDTGQRDFLKDFIENHRADSTKVGDDNCQDTFRGMRPSGQAGVDPTTVFFSAPYRDQPPIDRPAPPPAGGGGAANPLEDVLSHNEATATRMTALNTQRGVTELTRVEEPFGPGGTLVSGVSDVTFQPYPAGGDNYRFLLTLTDASGTDVRQLRLDGDDNFVPAPTGGAAPPPGTLPIWIVENNRQVPHPCCFTSGKFTIWRRINMPLVVFTNSNPILAPGATPPATGGASLNTRITWPDVKRRYKEAFVEISGPGVEHHLDQNGWRNLLQSYFRSAGTGVSLAQINNNANYTGYMQALFPPFLQTPPAGYRAGRDDRWTEWQWEHLDGLVTRAVRNACNAEGITPRPRRSSRQRNSHGFCIFLTRDVIPTGVVTTSATPGIPTGAPIRQDVGGMYVGEQQFHMIDSNTTTTLTHELGHGLYLRHGNTAPINNLAGSAAPTTYVPAAGANIANVQCYSLRESDGNGVNHLDHDQADFNDCIMSYENTGANIDFCAVCLLTLRYYDRVRLANNERPAITAGWDPVQICEIQGANLSESPNNLARGGANRMLIVAVAKFEANPNNLGRVARLVNTIAGTRFTITPATPGLQVRRGADNNHWVVTATNAVPTGNYNLNFVYNGANRGAPRQITIV